MLWWCSELINGVGTREELLLLNMYIHDDIINDKLKLPSSNSANVCIYRCWYGNYNISERNDLII